MLSIEERGVEIKEGDVGYGKINGGDLKIDGGGATV